MHRLKRQIRYHRRFLNQRNLVSLNHRRLNDGRATMHAIEFGQGPKVGGDHNFIVQLAQQNGGEYRYVDVTQLLQP